MPLTKHIILISGAGGGLGGVAAQALAQQNATLILLDKHIKKLECIYDKITALPAPTPFIYPFDLAGASETQYEELAQTIKKQFGQLNGLLHSANAFDTFTPMSIHSSYAWGHTLNVNLNAPFLLTKVLLPLLETPAHASIVFTGDSFTQEAKAYSGAYGVSKAALNCYAKILAEELKAAQKIRVNILIPHPINTPLRKKAFPAENNSVLPAMASLAPIYQYLFGEQSLHITAQTIDARKFQPN